MGIWPPSTRIHPLEEVPHSLLHLLTQSMPKLVESRTSVILAFHIIQNECANSSQNVPYYGWTKSCTTWKPCLKPWFVGIFRESTFPESLRWCELDFVHPRWNYRIQHQRYPEVAPAARRRLAHAPGSAQPAHASGGLALDHVVFGIRGRACLFLGPQK